MKLKGLLLLLLGSLLLQPLAARAADRAPTATPTPDRRFGAIEAWMAPEQAAALRVGWDRMLLDWHLRQPDNAEQWFVSPDETQRVDTALAAGREMVILLRGTPPWATDGPPYAGVPRGLYLPVDDPGNLWAAFVRRVVGEYAGRVNRWIIWNEPDIAPEDYGAQFYGSLQDYYQLVKVAYLAAKQANPQAAIHLAGMTHWHDVVYRRAPYLQRFLDLARQDPTARANNYYFDVVTLHIYFRTETVMEIIRLYRGILDRYGLQHPIWLNETNAAPADDPKLPWNNAMFSLTMEEQAAFIVQSFALALAAGAERVSVYKLAEINPIIPGADYNGLYRPDGSARPAVDAFRAVTTHFAGLQRVSHLSQPDYYSIRLDRGRLVTRVLWTRGDQPVSLRLRPTPGAISTSLYNYKGKAQPLVRDRAGAWLVTLPAAECDDPRVGCVVGGPPLILVETIRPK